MVTGYEIFEDGTLKEIELTKESLDSMKVLCVVDDSSKSIYLWKGSQANIRRKFIGARVATNLRSEYGFNFKVRPVDEGEEPPTFFSALDGTTTAIKVMKPGDKAPPPRPPTPKVETTQPSAEKPAMTPAAPPPTPQTPRSTRPPPVPTATARPSSSSADAQPVHQSMIDEMIKELETVAPPEGYQRELLIVYNTLFTVAEHKISVFGQEKVERRFEKVKDPPEGTFMAEGFIPRVIVKNGKVLGIELLKGTPDAILSPIKAEMKERLGDLITFFRTEVEEKKPKAAKTKSKASKKKSKLVAK
ncbi:MAG: hypothetical protein KAW94_01540 [Candidatus Thorarchaeota archaeon]|jgi:hypothetical protein|nr:hypothetical protein [Candidatus Thorarchaeota archaeon]